MTLVFLFAYIYPANLVAKSFDSNALVIKLYDWPPFYYGNEDGNVDGGIVIPVIYHIISKLNQEYSSNFKIKPIKIDLFNQILAEIKLGKTHMTLGSRNPDREKYAVFSDPIFEVRWYFFYLNSKKYLLKKVIDIESSMSSKKNKKEKNHPKYSSDIFSNYDKLKGLRIGLVKGYNYGLSFYKTSLDHMLDVRYSDSPKDGLTKLMNDKLDLVVLSNSVKKWIVENNIELSNKIIKKLDRPIRKNYYLRLFISKKSALSNYIDKINRIVHSMKIKKNKNDSFLKSQLGENAVLSLE